MLCRRLLALFSVLNSCTGVRTVTEVCSCPPLQTYPLNPATFPNLSVEKAKTFGPHRQSAGCAWAVHSIQHSPALQLRGAGTCKDSAWSGTQRCVVFIGLLPNARKPARLGTCLPRSWAASLCLASWLDGHLAHVAHGTEFDSTAQLSVRGPGPCWQITLPAPSMKMDWSKWSIRSSSPKISWKCELRPL